MTHRIWNPHLKTFVCPLEFLINGAGEVFYECQMEGILTKCEGCIVQRSSGLLDEEGKVVFQGDFLRIKNWWKEDIRRFNTYEVNFDQGIFYVRGSGFSLIDYLDRIGAKLTGCIVVGNIFEGIKDEKLQDKNS